MGFTKNTARRHRRVGSETEVTVTSKLPSERRYLKAIVAESSKIGESETQGQTEKTAIISFSRVFLRKFCTKTELTQSFCATFRRSRIERARFS